MMTVCSMEFQRNFGRYQELALTEPVAATRHRHDRKVLKLEDFTAGDIKDILAVEPLAAVPLTMK